MEKAVRSLGAGWLIVKSSPVFLYSALSVAAVYVVTFNYLTIVDLIGHNLETNFLTSFFASTIAFLIIGAFLHEKLILKGHAIWNLLGIIFGITLLLPITGLSGLVLFSLLGGLSVGLYVPFIVTHIINRTTFDNRGSVSGLFVMIVYLLIIACSFFINTAAHMGVLLILIKLINTFLVLKIDFVKSPSVEAPFMKYGVTVKTGFCFIWFIFLLVNALVSNVIVSQVGGYDFFILNTATLIVGLASMTLGGVVMDETGRKKLLVFSYAYLGFEYALVTLSGGYLIKYTYLDGIAWGILTVFFIMVLAGDIIFPRTRSLFVSLILALATLGLYLRNLLYVINVNIPVQEFFSLTSVFLFVAVVVMLFLPETLPDRVLQKKELQDYLHRAKKVKEKYR